MKKKNFYREISSQVEYESEYSITIPDTIDNDAKLRKGGKFFERKISIRAENHKNWPCIMTEDVPPGNKIVRAVEGGRIFLLFLPRGSRDFFLPTLHNTSVTLFNVTKRYVMNQLPPDFPRRYFSRKSVLCARHDCFKNNFARHEFIPRFKNH